MKKVLLIILISCFINQKAICQNSLYLTLQAGPKISYSRNYGPKTHQNTKGIFSSNFGLGIGYKFKNLYSSVETGVYKTNNYTYFDLHSGRGWSKEDAPLVYLSQPSWQIPLRLKAKIWQPADKFTIRTVVGLVLALTPDKFNLKGDVTNVQQDFLGIYFQTDPIDELSTRYHFSKSTSSAMNSNWLIESGFEAEYQINKRFSTCVAVFYQNGVQNPDLTTIYREDYDFRYQSTYFTYLTQAASQGNGLNFNAGLNYAF